MLQLTEDPDCTTSQIGGRCSMSHYADEGKAPYPVDYSVPNFGQDWDVKTTLSLGKDAAADYGVNWSTFAQGKPADPPPRDYFVPNFGVDHEIVENA